MTRGLVGLAVLLLAAGCTVAGPGADEPAPRPRPATPAAPGVPPLPSAEPALRVGLLVDVATARVESPGPLELVDEAGRVRARSTAGQAWTLRPTTAGVEAAGAGEAVRVTGALLLRPTGSEPVRVDGRAYRGTVLALPAAGGVTVINVLDLETYLLGVVPREIGAGRPPEEVEAVKAQAVAARTYAVRHVGRRGELGFDLYATVMDQAYGGADAEDPVSTRAVRETRGEILVHEGVAVEAYYHSTCGGRTAALEEVWPGEPRPYLRSVSDARPDGGWYCESSNRFRWSEYWDRAALTATLTRGLHERGASDGPVTRIDALSLAGLTPSGRAQALDIRTNLGEHRVRGDSIRWVLRPTAERILNSAAITLHPGGNGQVQELLVEGAGWGHGIGMCQVGALGRARDGHSYRDILSTYYPGTRIVRLYP
jgi:stage II sporulation protein D